MSNTISEIRLYLRAQAKLTAIKTDIWKPESDKSSPTDCSCFKKTVIDWRPKIQSKDKSSKDKFEADLKRSNSSERFEDKDTVEDTKNGKSFLDISIDKMSTKMWRKMTSYLPRSWSFHNILESSPSRTNRSPIRKTNSSVKVNNPLYERFINLTIVRNQWDNGETEAYIEPKFTDESEQALALLETISKYGYVRLNLKSIKYTNIYLVNPVYLYI